MAMGKQEVDPVYRSASFAAWKVSNRASDARRYAKEADKLRDQLITARAPVEVLTAADSAIARVHAAARDAMTVWEQARALVERSTPDAIEQVGGMYILRAPRDQPIDAPTATDVRYNDAYQAMVRGRAALDELIAIASSRQWASEESRDPERE
jgi:hypothetical protein